MATDTRDDSSSNAPAAGPAWPAVVSSADGAVIEVPREAPSAWRMLLALPFALVAIPFYSDWVVVAVALVFSAILARGIWNVIAYERATPLLRIEGDTLTWFGDIGSHRFSIRFDDIRSLRIDYVGLRLHPFHRMTIVSTAGVRTWRSLSPTFVFAFPAILPLLRERLGERFAYE